jgi:ATP/ADP translocase
LVAVAGVIITAREPGENIVKSFFNFHSIGGLAFDWAYKFYFLKYLFIVIPGMWAGELFLVVNSKTHEAYSFKNSIWSILTLGLLIALLSLLFIRGQALLCWAVLLALVIAAWCRKLLEQYTVLTYALTRYGLFFLLMGLVLEPFEGGIKKDPSTFSYYFMTTGFGFLILVLSKDLSGINWLRAIRFWFAGLGKNPLVAYVAGSLLILPLLSISGLRLHWDSWVSTPWQGFLKGVIFTAMVSAITLFFNRKNWIWRS